MNELAAYEADIHLQLEFLESFQRQPLLLPRYYSNVIFSGSGDSFAASMLAEYFSGHAARSMDPMDLYKNRQLLRNRTVYFISISGSTISNIRSAKIAPKSVAITANPDSMLAKSCTRIIPLQFPNAGIFTAGSIGFLSSALTCISLFEKFKIRQPARIFAKAKMAAKATCVSGRIFLLGNSHTFPLAMYCAAKFYEILGIDAHYCRLEQFSHMELFSAKSGDTAIIFDEPSSYGRRLENNLRSAGLAVFAPKLISDNMISRTLYFIFYSQLLPLFMAKSHGQNNCHFVMAKKLRNSSCNMIY